MHSGLEKVFMSIGTWPRLFSECVCVFSYAFLSVCVYEIERLAERAIVFSSP